ncbi:FAD:protein FMN transferase [Hoeflea alexandrii]|uniref:FAD:protein FMN transferase n=1 Tax=Hoeflea alexandrii TaxID=288436 RepID=UPI0022B01716|nr:FAD:protein FMN transferase [Hoeflea alexandrii]MCZ4288630.1 FAD:protein FMN transferase [Hoeflea alexandrii]
MPKTFTDLTRHALNGETMGTRWSALFHKPADFDVAPVAAAMAAAVNEVDRQMSTWKPDSDLMRLNAAPPGVWVECPEHLMIVLETAISIGRASGGAFDIGVGDAVSAWGFGPATADPGRIQAALSEPRRLAHDILELDLSGRRVRKSAPVTLDLSGIAKGYGVDRLTDVARRFQISDALLSIDGELRGIGLQPDGSPWSIAIEDPDYSARKAMAIVALEDAAVATSGDYRHWIDVGGKRLSHTMDPSRGGPLARSPASVTVFAETCMAADAWATVLMVKGSSEGVELARQMRLSALFVERDGNGLRQTPVGPLFEPADRTQE